MAERDLVQAPEPGDLWYTDNFPSTFGGDRGVGKVIKVGRQAGFVTIKVQIVAPLGHAFCGTVEHGLAIDWARWGWTPVGHMTLTDVLTIGREPPTSTASLGATCAQCGQHNEYADPPSAGAAFICGSCRSYQLMGGY